MREGLADDSRISEPDKNAAPKGPEERVEEPVRPETCGAIMTACETILDSIGVKTLTGRGTLRRLAEPAFCVGEPNAADDLGVLLEIWENGAAGDSYFVKYRLLGRELGGPYVALDKEGDIYGHRFAWSDLYGHRFLPLPEVKGQALLRDLRRLADGLRAAA